MSFKKALAVGVVLALASSLFSPAAVAKKKGPKPYKSEEGIIAVPHTLLHASSGEVNSVTANEFQTRCAIPATNGLDAYVYEVPKEYQSIDANIVAHGSAQVAWSLYVFFYDADCKRNPYNIEADGTVTMADGEGIMPAGTVYVLIADFAGDPCTIYYELEPV